MQLTRSRAREWERPVALVGHRQSPMGKPGVLSCFFLQTLCFNMAPPYLVKGVEYPHSQEKNNGMDSQDLEEADRQAQPC